MNNDKWSAYVKRMDSALTNFEKLSVGLMSILLVLTVSFGMFVRYMPFDTGLLSLGAEEFGRLALVWLWIWAGAVVQRMDRHYRLTFLTDRMSKRTLAAVQILVDTIIVVLMVILSNAAYHQVVRSLGNKTMALEWPQVIFTLPVVIGTILIGLYSLIRVGAGIQKTFSKSSPA